MFFSRTTHIDLGSGDLDAIYTDMFSCPKGCKQIIMDDFLFCPGCGAKIIWTGQKSEPEFFHPRELTEEDWHSVTADDTEALLESVRSRCRLGEVP